jgi:5-methylcytosine-specific restriction endonuclease McrA
MRDAVVSMTYFRDRINKELVVELYMKGMCGQEVAEHIGRPKSVREIHRIIKEAGVSRSRSEAFTNAIARGRMVHERTTAKRFVTRKWLSPKLRAEIMIRDHYRCVLCGATSQTDRLEIDHVNNDPSDDRRINLRILCQSCNLGKEALYRQELRQAGIERPKPRGKLPLPTTIVFCRRCRDITPVATDRHGDYCADCQRTIKPRPRK